MNLPRELRWIALSDLLIGLTMLLADPSRTASHVYDPAKQLLTWQSLYPLRLYGIAALILAVLTFLCSVRPHDGTALSLTLTAGIVLWVFWFVTLAVGVIVSHGTGWTLYLLLPFIRRHWMLIPVHRGA